MSELIEIKAKSRSGQTVEIQVSEIISIDGRPYRSHEQDEDVIQMLNHLSGRITTLETIVAGGQQE